MGGLEKEGKTAGLQRGVVSLAGMFSQLLTKDDSRKQEKVDMQEKKNGVRGHEKLRPDIFERSQHPEKVMRLNRGTDKESRVL